MLKTEMRQEVRAEIGKSLSKVLDDDEASSVHFVAGVALNVEPATHPTSPSNDEVLDSEPPTSELEITNSSRVEPRPEEKPTRTHTVQDSADTTVVAEASAKSVEQIVRDFALDIKECLTRQGRAPFMFAGLHMFDDLVALRDTFLACLDIHEHPDLRLWTDALTRILADYTSDFADVTIAQQWLDHVSAILDPPPHLLMLANQKTPRPVLTKGQFVQGQFTALLKRLASMTGLSPFLIQFRQQLLSITQNYWSGLFHCYDIPGLPTSNNALENRFAQTKRHIRRRLGIHHLRHALRRQAPWALLETAAASAAELTQLFQHVPLPDYHAQRALFDQRLQQLLHRFQWRHRRQELLQNRLNDWAAASPIA